MRDLSRCFLIRPSILFLLFAGVVFSSPTIAAAKEEKPEAWQTEAGKLFRQGNCAQAWQAIWKEARKGNTAALAGILGAMSGASLIPPSYFPPGQDRSRDLLDNFTALAIYARKDKVFVQDMLRRHGMISDDLMGDYEPDVRGKIQSVNRCLKGKHNVDICYEKAVKLRLIPSFEQYVALMDNAPRPAFCLPDSRPRPTSAEELGLGPRASEANSVPLTQKAH